MNQSIKRMNNIDNDENAKKVKKECTYGESCYRLNPAHFREFCHPHLETILDSYSGTGPYEIPDKFHLQKILVKDQLNVIVEKKLYQPKEKSSDSMESKEKSSDARELKEKPSGGREPKAKSSDGREPKAKSSDSREPKEKSSDGRELKEKSSDGREPKAKSSGGREPKAKSSDSREPKEKSSDGRESKAKSSDGRELNEKSSDGREPKEKSSNGREPKEKSSNGREPKEKSSEVSVTSSSDTRGISVIKKTNDSQIIKKSVASPQSSSSSQSKNSIQTKGYSSTSPTPRLEKKVRDSDYRPIVLSSRKPENFLKVVLPRNKMASKHEESAPYYMFYTTISDEQRTHRQPFSITFLELLDRSLGELKCSLQINFMVDAGWLLAQYHFAGYSAKKLTILYEDDCGHTLKDINIKKSNVEALYVNMATPFGKHHTKMMLLCYEDGSMRVVVSTANLYSDDWENRTQGLWFSPCCPELPPDSMPHDGESPTMFKRSLTRYLGHYHLPQLMFYLDRVKRCDFSKINVFLVSSVPGSHFDMDFGMKRVGLLLRQHAVGSFPLLAQASSLGSYGAKPSLWLTGDFLTYFTKTRDQPQTLTPPAPLKIIYPSLDNVKQSHAGVTGGGCLPYAAELHSKQAWLNDFLYQWRSIKINRNKAMPHIKTYTRVSPNGSMAAYFLLTSANISKAAWGSINKGNKALRIMSYECGVLFLPKFVLNKDYFPLEENAPDRLLLPYDVPPVKYTSDMMPWVSDYLY